MRQTPKPVQTHETASLFSRSMKAFLTLEQAIQRGEAEQVAYFLGESPDVVRRWKREPETEEGTATGRRSPLDRVCDLITAVFLTNPEGADLIVEHVRAHLEMLKAVQSRPSIEIEDLRAQVRDAQMLLTKVSDQLSAASANKLSVVK
jgi:hypothetical protein